MDDVDNIDKLINQIKNDELKINLKAIKIIVAKIWTPSIYIIKNYPNHDIKHSNRVAGHIIKILDLYKNDKPLSDKELFLLTAGVCLHDIGMQCDIKGYSGIKGRE
jgi:HD-GYP domain-containing protein (c-di-GMP phosphodiesterase class II)